jgi:hypothetical protein
MSWQEGVGIALVCIGLLGGAYAVAQRPAFWIEFGGRLIKAMAPAIWGYVSKRMPESDERAWQECERRGGRWNHRTRKCDR